MEKKQFIQKYRFETKKPCLKDPQGRKSSNIAKQERRRIEKQEIKIMTKSRKKKPKKLPLSENQGF